MAKLTKQNLEEIKALRREGRTLQNLADTYGVSVAMVHSIVQGVHIQGRCQYCGCNVAHNGTICGDCIKKRKLVRELLAIGKLIRAREQE